ncbi:MAG: FecR domain-containing protein [Pseudomonadota bacterium]
MRDETKSSLPEELVDEAMEWLVRCSIDNCSEVDHQKLELWLQRDDAHREAYELADLTWQKLAQLPRSQCSPEWFGIQPPVTPAPDPALIQSKKAQGWRRPWAWGGASAAALVVVVWLVGAAQIKPGVTLYNTQVAEIKEVMLEDGTLLALGAETTVGVTYTDSRRTVSLDRGEVFFDVASNPKRPFTVSSAALNITAVGTAFEVSRAGASVDVAVVEGIVDVASRSQTSKEADVRLTQGQRVKSVGGALLSVETVAIDAVGAWRGGELAYVRAPLSEIISDADRYYSGTIEIMDASLSDLSVSLILDAGDTEGLLNTLETVVPIRVSRLSDGTFLITRPYEG